eukprot:jgi/Chlat1/2403/Chrsp17S02661
MHQASGASALSQPTRHAVHTAFHSFIGRAVRKWQRDHHT